MQITINGETKEFSQTSFSVLDLLEKEQVESPEMVSVQVNGNVVDRSLYAETAIKDHDEIDFLYFMGGGA